MPGGGNSGCLGMRRRCAVGLAVLAAMGAGAAGAQTSDDVALEFVRTFQLGDNLRQMATTVIGSSIGYRVIVSKLGEEGARALVAEQLGQSVARYQDQWDRNLAASFLDYFTAPELASLMREKRDSPYVAKWLTHRDDIGRRMEGRSRDLLVTVVAEALANANAAAPEPPPR